MTPTQASCFIIREIAPNYTIFGSIWMGRNLGQKVLVGGWTNPSEKYARQIGSFPRVGVKRKKYTPEN